ncbi:hypothetical protein D8674_032718 [Pyrus ussuriensis x Pyrus communis]|uniref:DUF4216 domain-containing protein n=1 Tax=Pyrus ussuriensis x Pyrus communis TaxID=2448454 RepID=A0A5N5HMR8_9ROSA|nr:hypothetical protein D8674_032718 [Pyrus ussuriensis x Pyrus communis]
MRTGCSCQDYEQPRLVGDERGQRKLHSHDIKLLGSLFIFSWIDFIFTYRSYVENAQKTRGRRVTMLQAEKEAIKSFPDWFEKHVNQLQQSGDPRATDDLVALANGPSKWCRRYKIFVCNGFRFKVRGTQSNGNYQNYGVFLQSNVPSYAGPRDRNPVTGLVDYYGVLTDVFEIKYHMERTVVLFKCNWFDGTSRNTDVEHATGDNDESSLINDLYSEIDRMFKQEKSLVGHAFELRAELEHATSDLPHNFGLFMIMTMDGFVEWNDKIEDGNRILVQKFQSTLTQHLEVLHNIQLKYMEENMQSFVSTMAEVRSR